MAEGNALFQALHRVADRLIDPMADEVLRAFGVVREAIDLDELEVVLDAIYARAAIARAAQAPPLDATARESLARVLRFDLLDAQLAKRLTRILSRLTTGGALVTLGSLPDRVSPAFNLVNPKAVTFAKRHAGKLVREIDNEQRKLVNRMVARGIREGRTTRQTAKELRASIGLTRHQEGIVRRFGDVHVPAMREAEKLNKQQRKRLRQLQSGVPKTDAEADRLVEKYRARKIRDRAQGIARTETVRASAGGQQAVWDTAADEGLIIRDETRQFWHYAADSRTSCSCKSIPPLNPKGVPLGKPFKMRDCHTGEVRDVFRPGDTHPLCRCTLYVKFTEA